MRSKIFSAVFSCTLIASLFACSNVFSESTQANVQLPEPLKGYQSIRTEKVQFTSSLQGELLTLKDAQTGNCLGALFVLKAHEWTFDELSQRFLDDVLCNATAKAILGKYIPYDGGNNAIVIPSDMLPKPLSPDIQLKGQGDIELVLRHAYEGFIDGFYLLERKQKLKKSIGIFKLPSPSDLTPYPSCRFKHADWDSKQDALKVTYLCTMVGADQDSFSEHFRYKKLEGSWAVQASTAP